MEVQQRAAALEAQGRSIVHMEIGQPDFGAPPQVIAAGMRALEHENIGYAPALGLMKLRVAIADFYRARYSVAISPERIILTAGASGALLLALGVLLDSGAEVLMPDPCYPCYRNFVRLYDGVPNCIPVDAAQHYQLDTEQIAQAWQVETRGLILASPSNPTGMRTAAPQMRQLIEAARSRNGFVIVDEIYHGLEYDAAPYTALQFADDIFVLNSFSKYFGMTGWRLGWMVVPETYLRALEKLAQNTFICVSAPAQYAALAAFQADTLQTLEKRRQEFQRRRDFLLPALRELGFSVPLTPDGAFYIYAGCEAFSKSSQDFGLKLLEQAGVAITPGFDFGVHAASTHLRFAYTCDMATLEEAVDRLACYLRTAA